MYLFFRKNVIIYSQKEEARDTMNKYKWDFKEIRDSRNKLIEMYNKASIEDKPEIKQMIELYGNMLMYAREKEENSKVFDDIFQGLSTMDLITEVSWSYIEKNLEILDTILKAYTTVNENFIAVADEDPKVICTNDEIINITKDFFKKMTPSYIYEEFLEELNNNKNFLNISYSKKNGEYGGVTIFDAILNKKYVSVSRNNCLFDIVTLPHEMFHYLFNDTNVGILGCHNTYYLTEVEGSFANILFGEYFKENSTYNNLYFIRRFLNSFQGEMDDLAVRNQLLDSIKNNNKIRLNKLNKFMHYYNINKFEKTEDINKYLETPQEIVMKYTLSYLTALDLYYIYLKDREFAFYLLKNIRFVKEDDDIIGVLRRNHITFMDDDYENYKKYTKKLILEEHKYEKV